jgi:hypothetical protein
MKIPVLITVAALACGSALAQSSSTTSDRDTSRSRAAATATDTPSKASDEGIVAKTKRAFQRMGEKIRSAGNKSKDNADKAAAGSDTRSMGAAGSDSADSGRRARMDEAYANSKKSKSQDK